MKQLLNMLLAWEEQPESQSIAKKVDTNHRSKQIVCTKFTTSKYSILIQASNQQNYLIFDYIY